MIREFVLMLVLSISPTTFAALSSSIPQFAADFPKSLRIYFTHALNTLYSVRGGSGTDLHYKIFGGPVDGDQYRKWFMERVRRIEIVNDQCNFTAKIDPLGEPGVIYISSCVDYNPEPEKLVYWLSILFHEARHLDPENNHWKHQVTLDSSGMPTAIDSSPMGSFGLEKILTYNLMNYCSNCDQSFNSQAREIFEDEASWLKLSLGAIDLLIKDRNTAAAMVSKGFFSGVAGN